MNIFPIGTVVSLTEPKDAKRMIIGYLPRLNDELYDYLTVIYPAGILFNNLVSYIKSEQISKVEQLGYQNDLFLRMEKNFPGVEKDLKETESKKE